MKCCVGPRPLSPDAVAREPGRAEVKGSEDAHAVCRDVEHDFHRERVRHGEGSQVEVEGRSRRDDGGHLTPRGDGTRQRECPPRLLHSERQRGPPRVSLDERHRRIGRHEGWVSRRQDGDS